MSPMSPVESRNRQKGIAINGLELFLNFQLKRVLHDPIHVPTEKTTSPSIVQNQIFLDVVLNYF